MILTPVQIAFGDNPPKAIAIDRIRGRLQYPFAGQTPALFIDGKFHDPPPRSNRLETA
jgi:hypothetical protein